MAGGGTLRPPYDTALALGGWGWKHRHLIFGRIALNGGVPEELSLRSFIDATYALIVEEKMAMGSGQVPLYLAVQATDEAIGVATASDIEVQAAAAVPTAADNDRALAQLTGMMGGLGG